MSNSDPNHRLLHPALLLLLRLRSRALVRRAVRGVRTVKGAAMFAVVAMLVVFWIASIVISTMTSDGGSIQSARLFMPMGMFALCVMTLVTARTDGGVPFTPAEVDLLFATPFRRRDILIYRMVSYGLNGILLSLFLSLVLLPHVGFYLAGFLGLFLALSFIQLFQIVAALLASRLSEHLFSRGRKILLVVVIVALGLGIAQALGSGQALGDGNGAGVLDKIKAVGQTIPAQIILAPFSVFASTITARTLFPELIGWGSLGLLLDASLVALVLRLDVHFMQNSIATSARLQQRIKKVRSGNIFAGSNKRFVRLCLPKFPWLGGAGPLFWRQSTTALRSVGGMAWMLGIFSLSLLPMLILSNRPSIPSTQLPSTRSLDDSNTHLDRLNDRAIQGSPEHATPIEVPTEEMLADELFAQDLLTEQLLNEDSFIDDVSSFVPFAMILAASLFFLPQMLRFDFRGDVDHIGSLKSLPIRPLAIVFGQLATPVVLSTAIQSVAAAALLIYEGVWTPWLLLAVIVLPPINLIVYGIENLFFLMFPHRIGTGVADVQGFARQMLLMFGKFVVLGVVGGVIALFAALVFWLTQSWSAVAVVGCLLLILSATGLMPLVLWGYQRYDPSTDTPP